MDHFDPIPTAPRSWPLLGHASAMLRDPLALLNSLPPHGDLVRINLGPTTLVVVCDPELTWAVLQADDVFDKGGPMYDRIREVIGDGIASCPHAEHGRLRGLVQPGFATQRIRDYAPAMTARIGEVVGAWTPGQILDVPDEMLHITSTVTTASLFSDHLPTGLLDQVLRDIRVIFDGAWVRIFQPGALSRIPTRGNRAYNRARAHLRATIEQLIAARRAGGSDRDDLLGSLLAAHDPEDGSRLSSRELADTVVTLVVAGGETTATALSWALDLLARHPEVLGRLHVEVDAILGGRAATIADLDRLPLTRQVITETLRLCPPTWMVTRRVTVDTQLGRHLLPAGTDVVYSPYLIHHRADLYDDPERWDPDRWDPGRTQPRHAFFPFAAGRRKCVGSNFAMATAVLTLATVTTRWDLTHLPGHGRTLPHGRSVSLKPRELLMHATPRARDAATPHATHPGGAGTGATGDGKR